MTEANQPIPTYEAARDELVQIVTRLESGAAPLDEALSLWERGEQLAAVCQRWLDGARAKIDAARSPADEDDQPHTEPADA
ncbi:MAG TPA: exodeoxyribonuclease VII small subunit [Microlunatus sp.]|jgi:exodeoxyribonuclease VII small subunit|nr:exodeoxyribonuclease VII small subunit [Microlunatus sp.]